MSGKRAAAVAERRRDLIAATVATIHARGSLDVTMAEIAGRAGVSPGLAHHYFGSKDGLISETLRHLLRGFFAQVRAEWDAARTPRARVSGLVRAAFGPEQFAPETVSAWLSFYVLAQHDPGAGRLLRVYVRRLRTHLVVALRPLAGDEAEAIAEAAGALIDGVYLRHALSQSPPDPAAAIALVDSVIEARIDAAAQRKG
jgi:transcriptional repressor BetI